jgi:hypothetical protein
MVPLTDTMPLVRETTISSETRTVMANKIKEVRLRKYLRPDDSANFVKDIVLPLNLRGHHAEFAFYIDEMLYGLSVTLRTALKFQLLKEATNLPYASNDIRAGFIE